MTVHTGRKSGNPLAVSLTIASEYGAVSLDEAYIIQSPHISEFNNALDNMPHEVQESLVNTMEHFKS